MSYWLDWHSGKLWQERVCLQECSHLAIYCRQINSANSIVFLILQVEDKSYLYWSSLGKKILNRGLWSVRISQSLVWGSSTLQNFMFKTFWGGKWEKLLCQSKFSGCWCMISVYQVTVCIYPVLHSGDLVQLDPEIKNNLYLRT